MKNYIDFLYDKKTEYKKIGDKSMMMTYKILMNSVLNFHIITNTNLILGCISNLCDAKAPEFGKGVIAATMGGSF